MLRRHVPLLLLFSFVLFHVFFALFFVDLGHHVLLVLIFLLFVKNAYLLVIIFLLLQLPFFILF